MRKSFLADVGSELKGFAEEDTAADDGEAGGLVDAVGKGVVDVSVGGHFAATLLARPVFCGLQKSASDALSAAGCGNEPAFDVADRACDIATVSGGTKGGFDKAEERVVFFGDEDDQRHYGVEVCRRESIGVRWRGGRRKIPATELRAAV